MRSEIKELRRLNHLLKTQRLTPSERSAVEQKIGELERSQTNQSIPTTGVFGVFDRPKPGKPGSDPVVVEAETRMEAKESSSTPIAETVASACEHELSPDEFEALADQIAAIADRIVRLRAYWARTLSVEVDRESQVWLAKLHEFASLLPEELLEVVLADRMYLVRQKVRDVNKPSISEKVQLTTIAPSAPSLDSVGTYSEFYYAMREPRQPRPPVHPPGYVPDGLQALVS